MGIEAMYEGTSWYGEIDTGEAPPPESTFDVIVVGGGPGGSSAAGETVFFEITATIFYVYSIIVNSILVCFFKWF